MNKAVQDFYPKDYNHCYGCGSHNKDGYQLKTRWDGDETLTLFTPKEYHTSIPGFTYGGLIASLVDCHGTGSAAAAKFREEGLEIGDKEAYRFVTGTITVKFLKPTPIENELEIRGVIKEIKGRKVIVDVRVLSKGELCATGEVIAIQLID